MKLSYNAKYNIKWILKALATMGAIATTVTGIMGGTTLVLIGISKFVETVTVINTFLEVFIAAAYILACVTSGVILVIVMIIAIFKFMRILF